MPLVCVFPLSVCVCVCVCILAHLAQSYLQMAVSAGGLCHFPLAEGLGSTTDGRAPSTEPHLEPHFPHLDLLIRVRQVAGALT